MARLTLKMPQFLTRLNYSKLGVITGLVLALPPLISVGVGSVLALRVTEGEIRANIQQAIGDTSLMMATHFREALNHLLNHIQKEGEIQLYNLKTSEAATANNPMILGSIKPPFETASIELLPEILDLSIWRRGAPPSVFDRDSAPQRRLLAMNSKFPAFTMDRSSLVVGVEEAEKQLINPAFEGRTLISLAPAILGVRKFATVAIPLGKGTINEVVVAHVNLSDIQENMPKNGLVTAVLVDDFGKTLIRPLRDSQTLDHLPGASQLLQKMKSSKFLSGQMNLTETTDSGSARYFGGYNRVGIGQVAVLASLSEAEGTVALKVLRTQLLGLWIVSFLVFFTVGYRISGLLKIRDKNEKTGEILNPNQKNRSDASSILSPSKTDVPAPTQTSEVNPLEAKKVLVTALFGSLRQFDSLFSAETPENTAESINDYLGVVASVAQEYGGMMERYSGGQSFLLYWGAPENEGTEGWRAVRCALQLRIEFQKLNELRKLDGQKVLEFCMGVHSGNALAARIGPPGQSSYTVLGDVLNCARSLVQLAANMGKDLCISQDVWAQSDAKFTGEIVGEAKLTQETGLISYYSISGYRNEQGEEIVVPAPVLKAAEIAAGVELINQDKKSERWLINNGSQIIGPFTSEEIANRLFAQELDFDCECWSEGLGTSSQIKTAGIFSGSQDEDANLWLFDGKGVHGPVSPGFLRTAIGHGAMQGSIFICEKSTVNGWKPLEEWEKTYFENAPTATLGETPVESSKKPVA